MKHGDMDHTGHSADK